MKKMTANITKQLLSVAILSLLSACTNMAALKGKATNSLTNPSYLTSSTSYTHTLQNVNITLLTTGSPPDYKISLAVTAGALPLTNYCGVGATGSKPCLCELTWTEVNTVGGNATSVSRLKKLVVTDVQSSVVKCQMTQAFWNEIPAGTTMHMNIIPLSPNSTGLSVQRIGYKKGTSVAPAGDFVDDTLTPFRNIYRYTCFSKRLASYEVLNSYLPTTYTDASGNSQPTNVILASRFCAESGTDCQTPRNGYSAVSYYRNLFVRSDKLGEINSTNARYDCPKVFESLPFHATDPVTTPAAEQGKYWPLDTTFALATEKTSEWSVVVPAASVLKKLNDTASDDDPEMKTSTYARDRLKELDGNNAGIAWKIMGYGKKPNANGTCGTIVDSNGRTRPLTRLRRYRVLYPSTFKNSGEVEAERPEADQVYVADRLVVDSGGTLTGNMIYGPKPCNFSWFDHEGVTNRTGIGNFQTNISGSVPIYRSTSNYFYDTGSAQINVNPDGKFLPNIDRSGSIGSVNGPSCSAAIAVYDSDPTGVISKSRILTSYWNRTDKVTLGSRDIYLGEVPVNPMERWSPEYVEDTSFQACVPLADPYLEPPLHFYRDLKANGGQVSWCAKVYPTQNPYWLELNSKKKPTGSTIAAKAVNWGGAGGNTNIARVKWYTSHVKGATGLDMLTNGATAVNSCTSTIADKICEHSLGSTGDPNYATCVNYLDSVSGGENRCDRTIMFDGNQDYRGLPLLASDDDIQSMLVSDAAKERSYACTYSVNSNPTKIGREQPVTNCCGMKAGTPLLNANPLIPAVNFLPYNTAASEGHMEPYMNPAVPNIRFCGNPVE